MDLNMFSIIGRVSRDLEIRKTSAGTAVGNFSIANNRTRQNQDGEEIQDTSFFDCTIWGPYASALERYVKKGVRVGLQGYLQQQSWDQDGVRRYKIQLIVDQVQLLNNPRPN